MRIRVASAFVAQPQSPSPVWLRARAALLALAVGVPLVAAPQRADAASPPSSQAPTPASVASDPTPEQIQFAAEEHDQGYRAYVAKQYDEAAVHFENAFFAAPNPAELRSAIRARHDAGERARAATLAAIGRRKFPGDAALAKLADETIAWATPQVFQIHIASPEECSVAVDDKVVAVERVKDFRFFVDPGHHALSVGWTRNRATKLDIDAVAAGSKDLNLQPPAAPPPPPSPLADGRGPSGEIERHSVKPLSPLVFVIGTALTVGGAAVTVWSGIDTENNPGRSAVKADCVGQGTSCPQYQQGLSSQLRTNVLIGATAGVAVITAVVGIFFTRWSDPTVEPRVDHRGEGATGVRVTPVLGLGQAGFEGTF